MDQKEDVESGSTRGSGYGFRSQAAATPGSGRSSAGYRGSPNVGMARGAGGVALGRPTLVSNFNSGLNMAPPSATGGGPNSNQSTQDDGRASAAPRLSADDFAMSRIRVQRLQAIQKAAKQGAERRALYDNGGNRRKSESPAPEVNETKNGPSTILPPINAKKQDEPSPAKTRGKRGHDNDEVGPDHYHPGRRVSPQAAQPRQDNYPKNKKENISSFDDDELQTAIALSLSEAPKESGPPPPPPRPLPQVRPTVVDVDLLDEDDDDVVPTAPPPPPPPPTCPVEVDVDAILDTPEGEEEFLHDDHFIQEQRRAMELLRRQQNRKKSGTSRTAPPRTASAKRREEQERLDARLARQMNQASTQPQQRSSNNRPRCQQPQQPQLVAEGVDPDVINDLIAQGFDPADLGINVQPAPADLTALPHPSSSTDEFDDGEEDEMPPEEMMPHMMMMGGLPAFLGGHFRMAAGGGGRHDQPTDFAALDQMMAHMLQQQMVAQTQQRRGRGHNGWHPQHQQQQPDAQQDMSYEALLNLEDVPTPLPKRLLDQIPTRTFKKEGGGNCNTNGVATAENGNGSDPQQSAEEGPHCTICLMPYEEGDEVATLPDCFHEFHKDCVTEWFKGKKHCCVCKMEVGTHSQF